ncbi:heparan-alpha-glucosaminide N-acetyltransferase domain-containing protein [Endozoicomonas acroporae]|uniref:heparan-alpha-glucosaminide N-acetyltransferase domain-containing protein n=1 Tax=Endozoicomonas acroporae TaxID=1701104 RepID=UPI003D7B26C8
MTKNESNEIKELAITFMLLLHLFNTYEYHEIYTPYLLINGTPFTYYISLFADCCVVLFLYCSGYGLYFTYKKQGAVQQYIKTFPIRLKGLYTKY